MSMSLGEWSLFAGVLCFGIFVQSAAGFAAGLLIVPLLMFAGFPLPAAMAALLVATVPQNIGGVWSLRKHIQPRQIVWPAVGRLVGLPVGIAGLYLTRNWSPILVRQFVGMMVLLVTLSFIFLRVKPREHLHPAWAFLAFPMSGLMQGIVGMGGPPMVFWVAAHDWKTERSRGFLFALYLIGLLPVVVLLYWTFGDQVLEPSLAAILVFPLLIPATHLGVRFGTWLGRDRLRALTYTLLLCVGIAGIAAPLLRGY
ncbi:MAG: sulfite exporter TauE/SafE family protein [Planctomycetota bacterium]